MADRPDPYVRKDPNDIIRSGDWNELQIQTREEILKHTHTGRDDGRLIPGKAIDPTADISVSTLNTSGNLNVGGDLKVNGKALLGDIADLLATVKGLQDDKLSRAGGSVSGNLQLDKNLLVEGTVGIGSRLTVRGGAGGAGAPKDPDSGLGYGGQLAIKGNAAQLDFISTEYDDWAIYVHNNKMRFVRQPWSYELVLDGRGNVGIGTETPRAKLEVIGDLNVTDGFVRRISRATGIGSDPTSNGQIVSRVLTFNKVYVETAIRILYCDNFRVRRDKDNGEGAASWEIRIDGRSLPKGGICYDRYSVSGNYHQPATVIGYAEGISPGTHTIGVWVGPVSGYAVGDAQTGWASSRWTLEAQEVWI
ncbi:MAG: hypothetical protein AW09_000858 [Candidatus Accumulibacter phosphatis]|uniref:CTHRC1 C-terminal domain-containing protein n=1 Tax=Candidatus Accumulibacter phosphatis TaxID=327160 RepID=A0A080LYM9_9PROT|nr:MAG: hypothetical protein AW09_000858 [Candidatus Accumulibacter phosphatis]